MTKRKIYWAKAETYKENNSKDEAHWDIRNCI